MTAGTTGLYRAGTNGTGISNGGVSQLSLASSSGSGRSARSARSGGTSGSSGSVIRLAGRGDQTDLPYVLMPAASI